jgi:hypothetical protein
MREQRFSQRSQTIKNPDGAGIFFASVREAIEIFSNFGMPFFSLFC